MTAQDWKFTAHFFGALAVGYLATLGAEQVLGIKSRSWIEVLLSMAFAMFLMIPVMQLRDKEAL